MNEDDLPSGPATGGPIRLIERLGRRSGDAPDRDIDRRSRDGAGSRRRDDPLEAQRRRQFATARIDADGTFVVSPSFAEILGLERDQQTTFSTIVPLVHPLDRARWEAWHAMIVTEDWRGIGQNLEHRIRHPHRGLRWLRWSTRIDLSDDGIDYVGATVHDITAQRAIERRTQALTLIAQRQSRHMQQLARARDAARSTQLRDAEFLRALLDTVPMGVALFDDRMLLATWNTAMPDLAEIDARRLHVGLTFEAFANLHWQIPALRGDGVSRDAAGGIVAQRFERALRDGRIILVTVNPRPKGGIVKTYVDITRFKQTEERLRDRSLELAQQVKDLEKATADVVRSDRARLQFLSLMSHDVRTPVNGLLGMIGLLGDTALDSNQRALLSLARQSGDQLRLLLDDIAQATYSGELKIIASPSSMPLRETIDAAADFWQATVRVQRIVIDRSCDPALPQLILLDPKRFRQLLDNLLSNAVQWCGAHPIVVRAERRGDRLRLTVADRGPGVSPEAYPRLFATDADGVTDRSGGSARSGGLALCQRIVSAMAGSIGVEAVLPHGSRFWIDLPIALPPAAASPGGAIEDASPVWAGTVRPRILVAEDVETNRLVICAMLDSFGCDVTTVSDGSQAVAQARTGGIDAILMDVQMPVMDGMEATRRIRSLPEPMSRVPIIGVTAHVLPAEREILLAAGMEACLTKPISREALKGALRALMARRDAHIVPHSIADGCDPANRRGEPARIIDPTIFAAVFGPLSKAQRARLLDAANEDLILLVHGVSAATAAEDETGTRRALHSLEGVAGNFGAIDVLQKIVDLRENPADAAARAETLDQAVAAMVGHSRDLFVRLGLDRD